MIEGLERLVTAIAKLALIALLLECMIAIGSGIVWAIRKLRRKDDVWRIREISD
jgi:ABC-type dipeptide/oligopeptide/nickel transport system permease component